MPNPETTETRVSILKTVIAQEGLTPPHPTVLTKIAEQMELRLARQRLMTWLFKHTISAGVGLIVLMGFLKVSFWLTIVSLLLLKVVFVAHRVFDQALDVVSLEISQDAVNEALGQAQKTTVESLRPTNKDMRA